MPETIPYKITIFEYLLNFLDTTLMGYLNNNIPSFIASIAPIASAAFSLMLLFIIVGYWTNSDLMVNYMDFVKKTIVWIILIGFAFNVSIYTDLATTIYSLGDNLAVAFIGSTNSSADANTYDAIIEQFLNVNAAVAYQEVQWLKEHDGITEMAMAIGVSMESLFFRTFVWIAAAIVLIITFTTYFLTKVLLILTLCLGPLFIGFSLFPITRSYAMNWVNQCLNYTILTILVAVINSMVFAFVQETMTKVTAAYANGKDFKQIALLFPVSIIELTVLVIAIWFIVGKLPELASALTGGASGSSGARTAMGTIRGAPKALGAAKWAAGGMKSVASSVVGKFLGR